MCSPSMCHGMRHKTTLMVVYLITKLQYLRKTTEWYSSIMESNKRSSTLKIWNKTDLISFSYKQEIL